MRFVRQRPSGEDKDIPVYEFAMGVEEIRVILQATCMLRKSLPDIFELTSMKHRLKNITKELAKILNERENEKLK